MASLAMRVLDKIRNSGAPDISIMEQYGVPTDVARPDTFSNELEKLFWTKEGASLHKWSHYFDVYERHFSKFRGKPVRFLEIGVLNGGSLDMWRSYFGRDAVICGIDINPECKKFDGTSAMVRIGSQADPDFLSSVIEEMGGIDAVLDDGSHMSQHMRASLEAIFPKLSHDGVYMIEDTHACYWPSLGGGYKWPTSFMEYTKTLMDDLHKWYHFKAQKHPVVSKDLRSLHVYDSITVFEKGKERAPSHSTNGD